MTSERLFVALKRVLADLARDKRGVALVGGLAVSVRAEVRFTRDVDLAVVAVDDADAEGLVAALSRTGYSAMATVEQVSRPERHLRLSRGEVLPYFFCEVSVR